MNDVNYTWNINEDEVTQNFKCNHAEADTRTKLHATLSSEDEAVVAAGTDVLILMISAYSKFIVKQRCVFSYEDDICADIETILSYRG